MKMNICEGQDKAKSRKTLTSYNRKLSILLKSDCSQFAVNSSVIYRTPQESAGKELSCKSLLDKLIAS
jgi:hypothetical protein